MPSHTPVIALTGSMGAGKSEVAQAFASLGARVLDADILGIYALAKLPQVRQKVVQLLGEDVYLESGSPNRALIAKRVFASGEVLEKYEAILHPEIKNLWQNPPAETEYAEFSANLRRERESFAAKNSQTIAPAPTPIKIDEACLAFPNFAPLIESVRIALQDENRRPKVVEMPLLFEKKLEKEFDFCVDVYCSKRLRQMRLLERGMSAQDILSRDAFQLSAEKKMSLANAVVFNESTKLFLSVQVALILSRFI